MSAENLNFFKTTYFSKRTNKVVRPHNLKKQKWVNEIPIIELTLDSSSSEDSFTYRGSTKSNQKFMATIESGLSPFEFVPNSTSSNRPNGGLGDSNHNGTSSFGSDQSSSQLNTNYSSISNLDKELKVLSFKKPIHFLVMNQNFEFEREIAQITDLYNLSNEHLRYILLRNIGIIIGIYHGAIVSFFPF